MNEEQEIAEARRKRELYEAFWEESSDAIKPFREFWRKSGDTIREEAGKLDAVLGGRTPVSDQAVADCRQAVMRLHQFAHAISELSVGSIAKIRNDLCQRAMADIVVRAMDAAKKAERDMATIYQWVAAAERPSTSQQ
ncbi:hypothetical protein LN565_00165 [Xanthomonas euvesicatoria pv. euvesicatoria]|uniref:Uncharacterized protein n=2 Tax=Xanthomonas TaxID=338 RepID=A0AB73H3P1_9XANT|nr:MULTISPECIES: hypothetical protein [Xanthomonas]AOY69508.1 hypothetical protein BHE83_23270 [Xanthomonas euvesicatoria pv. vesicatoria str. 85-10]APO88964.1 hypothetical protein BJD11_01940 [Xanthomonas euvesicatoria]ATS91202.1 hypothetical protein XcfCFBP6167P_24030 [Xanthomonas citri pv. phaseoli var. fuscans]KLA50551.1 hypothetical protein XEUV685_20635 [Xanthomonas euvesicatoria]KLA50614.1 hypothetical protein XEUV683_18455 [Xanthomonas euvesicatoria]